MEIPGRGKCVGLPGSENYLACDMDAKMAFACAVLWAGAERQAEKIKRKRA